jgi:hypothetical protein
MLIEENNVRKVKKRFSYHLGEHLPALGVLLAKHMLLPSAPPHDLHCPRHPEPLHRRLSDTHKTRTNY